jgi:hypothetical protein
VPHRAGRPPDLRGGRSAAGGRSGRLHPVSDHGLQRPLFEIGCQGVRSLLVEGGPVLLGSFLAQRAFDVVTVYVAGPSARVAHAAARAVLPELPAMEAARLGSGTLLTGLARSRDEPAGA